MKLALLAAVVLLGCQALAPDPAPVTTTTASASAVPSSIAPSPASDASASEPEVPCHTLENRMGPAARAMGRRPDMQRIVGGSEVPEGMYPWAAALAYRSGSDARQFCGATLIKPSWLLTAAHCSVRLTDLALLGSVDLDKASRTDVVEVRTHYLYDSKSTDYDVAVVRLAAPTTLRTVDMFGVGDGPDEGDTIAIGWGATREGGPTTLRLRHVRVPIVGHADCLASYGHSITDRMLCAGKDAGGVDSCQGDSGGPLVMEFGESIVQVGVTSWGVGCARPGLPGVYASVSRLRSWIEACTQ